jgi:hypothetical protein
MKASSVSGQRLAGAPRPGDPIYSDPDATQPGLCLFHGVEEDCRAVRPGCETHWRQEGPMGYTHWEECPTCCAWLLV